MTQVRLFAGAAEAVGVKEIQFDGSSVQTLIDTLVDQGNPETARVLSVCAILVNGVRASSPDTVIESGSVVDVLPPFAGG